LSDPKKHKLDPYLRDELALKEEAEQEPPLTTTENQLRKFIEELRDMGGEAAKKLTSDQDAAVRKLAESEEEPDGKKLSEMPVRWLFAFIASLPPFILDSTLGHDVDQFVRMAVEQEAGIWRPFETRAAPCPLGAYGAPFPRGQGNDEE
jgi:hypothetical protein